MSFIKYQQGDVLLFKVTKEEFEKANLSTRITTHKTRAVLAEGEETGHYHAIYMEDMLEEAGITLCKRSEWMRENQGLIVEGNEVTIKHEEHNPITIPVGYYLQRIVKEYDPISGLIRGVAD